MTSEISELDDVLVDCNETELLQMARRQGLGILRRGIPRDVLIDIITGTLPVRSEYLAGTDYTRKKLEGYIYQNIGQTRSQLPGCSGHCPVYPCSEGRHGMCVIPKLAEI